MSSKDMRNLNKSELLAIIKKQDKEIKSLKDNIKILEDELESKTNEITNISSKLDSLLSDAEQYLQKIKDIHDTASKIMTEAESADKTDLEDGTQDITDEIECEEEKIIDTKESQIVDEENKCIMLIPVKPTDLAIIEPIHIYIRRHKWRFIAIYAISLLVIFFSVFSCLKVYGQDREIIDLTQDLQKIALANQTESGNNVSLNFDELNKINSDIVGWLKVPGIDIDMPVVQTDNNDYYLKVSYDKTNNLSGWAFVDCRNALDGSDKNVVIYGHNRRDNIIFSPLVNILKEEWYNNPENKNITFISEDGKTNTYEVFSIYQINVEDYYLQTDFKTDEEYQNFLNTIKSRSIKKYDAELSTEDKILTLSTCGNNSKYRVILHARLVK